MYTYIYYLRGQDLELSLLLLSSCFKNFFSTLQENKGIVLIDTLTAHVFIFNYLLIIHKFVFSHHWQSHGAVITDYVSSA